MMGLHLMRTILGFSDAIRIDVISSRFVRDALGSAGVQVVNRTLALALGMILARTLGAGGYGDYAYAFAIMSLLMVISEAGVPTLLMREVAASVGLGSWGLLRGAVQRGVQLVAMISVAVAVLGFLVLWILIDEIPTKSLYTLAAMLFVLPAAALLKTLAHSLRGLNKVVTSQALELILWPTMVILFVSVLFLINSNLRTPWVAMAVQFIALVIVIAFAALLLKRYMPVEARNAHAEFKSREWLKKTLPFAMISGALVINNQADIIILGWLTKPEDVGAYRVAVQISMLVFLPLQVLQSVLAPRFATLFACKDYEALRALDTRSRFIGIFITAPVFFIIMAFSEQTIIFVFGSDFREAVIPTAILSIGFFANVACGASGTLMQMTKHERKVLETLLFTSGLNIAATFVLIPVFGFIGAAISNALSTFIYQFVLRHLANGIYSPKRLKEQ